MDLSPLYELRARLRAAMIAGTDLLSEDFRLKRAAESFAPLEQASPVFAKIGQLTKALLSPDQKDKEGALLDAITLADAVLCTQGTVSAAGEMEPLRGSSWGSAVTNAPYSVIRKLLDSLLNSGSGHYNYVVETRKEHPEIFKDYRVKAAMVQALGASYAELAEVVTKWLCKEDASIMPLLQEGFDPKGKKEMVRRIQVMQAIDADAANEFFKKVLPDAEKEIRQAIIYSLRHKSENVGLLLELVKTEKGNARKMAYYALGHIEDERACNVFRELAKKKPVEAMSYLAFAETKWASALVVEKLDELLLPWADGGAGYLMTEEQSQLLDNALMALPGKSGDEICRIFRMAANLEERLKYPFEDKKRVWVVSAANGPRARVYPGETIKTLTFQSAVPRLLYQALYVHPDEAFCTLALELYDAEGRAHGRRKDYFPAALTAMLLWKDDCCDWLGQQQQELKGEFGTLLAEGLGNLTYSGQTGKYELSKHVFYNYDDHPAGEPYIEYSQPVKQEITGRFTDILMQFGNKGAEEAEKIDKILGACINSQDEAYCRKLGEYFYNRALKIRGNRYAPYLHYLKKCGFSKCENLAVNYVILNKVNAVYFSGLANFIQSMPGDNAAKYAEMKKVYDLYQKGQLEIREGGWTKEQFVEFMENYKTE